MKLSLTVLVAGPMEGKKIPIPGTKLTIGRDPQCDLQPGNPSIAPRHCALEIRDEKVFLKDLGSTTGTFVNDRQITQEVQVRAGDRFRVGPLLFGVSIEGIQQEAPKAAVPKPPAPKPVENKKDGDKQNERKPRKDASATTLVAEELLKKMFRRKGDERPII